MADQTVRTDTGTPHYVALKLWEVARLELRAADGEESIKAQLDLYGRCLEATRYRSSTGG